MRQLNSNSFVSRSATPLTGFHVFLQQSSEKGLRVSKGTGPTFPSGLVDFSPCTARAEETTEIQRAAIPKKLPRRLKHNPLSPWKLSVNWSNTTGLECC